MVHTFVFPVLFFWGDNHGCVSELCLLRDNEKRKKEEAELETPWDDIGSAFTEVHNMPVGSDDEDVDLDSMVV